MTQQDYNNQESLRRPEISEVTKGAINRRRVVTLSRKASDNALLIMKSANKGHIYETASKWAERSSYWSKESDFLSPVVESDHTQQGLNQISKVVTDGELKLDEVLELEKDSHFAENLLYLDAMNADKEPLDIFDVSPEGGYLSPEAQRIQEAQQKVRVALGSSGNDFHAENDNFTLAA